MFFKFASNVLQDLSNECSLKSFASLDSEDAKMYASIAHRLDGLIRRINVDGSGKARSKLSE